MKLHRSFESTTRYSFDTKECSYRNGWAQIDTLSDAWYYGQWCNPQELKIVSYAEGDITVTECESEEEFVEQLLEIKSWHNGSGWTFRGIDPGLNPDLKEKFVEIGAGDLLH